MSAAIDVWLKFDSDEDEVPTLEANTFHVAGGGYEIHWYHVDVGQVSVVYLGSIDEVRAWYEINGFEDYTS